MNDATLAAGDSTPAMNDAIRAETGRIELRDVTVSFPAGRRDRLVALDGVNLAIASGEIVSIIGPNGSGKSTLLRVLAGLLRPDRGEARLDGETISGPDPRIGLVFQDPRLLPWRTTARNVSYPLELAGWPRQAAEGRVRELLDRVGLSAAAESAPSQLSGGMQQRAGLARSMALEPSILLLDEPFTALDELTRERFDVELLRSWTRPRTTIVVVTHSVQEAIFLADRVIVLSERPGRVVADLDVALPRPRSIDRLDVAAVSAVAREIRRHLGANAA